MGFVAASASDGRRSSCLALAIIRLVKRKEKFVAVGINDSDDVVAPPRLLGWHRALRNLAAKFVDPIPGQLNEQTTLILAHPILAQNDFASSSVDLADCPLACLPFLLETQFVDVKPEGALTSDTKSTGRAYQ